MRNINDSGKIWLRGSVRPEYGVRVGEKYFVVGEGDSQSTIYSVYGNHLFVVLHYPEKKERIFRRFSLDLIPKSKGTLFNGFKETKHADINAITYQDDGVEEHVGGENDCFLNKKGEVDPIKIIELAGWG
jgi:hypothetical protein